MKQQIEATYSVAGNCISKLYIGASNRKESSFDTSYTSLKRY
jgi:hypothetical protein